MSLLQGDFGRVARVVSRVDNGLAVVNVQNVYIFRDSGPATALGCRRLLAFGKYINAVAALQDRGQRLRSGPPGSIFAQVDILRYLAIVFA